MNNENIRLQQDCNTLITELEVSISRIKAVCIEPDIDTACGVFAREVASIIAKCAVMLGGDIHTGEAV